jgi:hypothetical protein
LVYHPSKQSFRVVFNSPKEAAETHVKLCRNGVWKTDKSVEVDIAPGMISKMLILAVNVIVQKILRELESSVA